MRFDRLDILRYGALTDRKLTFREGARLHVVYGPNEAGKSSALSAISDLLFGFPERTDYGFLHDGNALRIGATLSSKDGAQVAFRRRKGRKNTLLAATDAEEGLADDALTPFIGTLSRDVFERAFGLNSALLRAGGDTMLKSGGEIGSLLFSAASGLTGLTGLRRSLDDEADRIYGPRKSKDRLFYQTLEAHDEARKAERENELKSGDWKALLKERASIEAEMQQALSAREETKRQLERLSRHMTLEPLLRELDREQALLAQFDDLPVLPEGFDTRLADQLETDRRNAEALHGSQAEIERVRDEIAAIEVDEALLAAAPDILTVYARSGVYLKAQEDIVRVRGEVDEFDQRLVQAARRLGLASATDLEKLQPSDADLAGLRQILDAGTELDREIAQLSKRIEEESDRLRALDADLPASRVVDPKQWSEQLAALKPEIDELANLEAVTVRLSRARGELDVAASRLDPPVGDVAQLLATPLPNIETLASHRRQIEAARQDAGLAAQKLVELRSEADELSEQVSLLESSGEIVSKEMIELARSARDEMIEALVLSPGGDAAGRVTDAVGHADRLADAALADAERVSRHAHMKLRQRKLADAIVVAENAAREADIAASDAVTEFEDLFHAVPVKPASPERMIEWRRAVDGLVALTNGMKATEDEFEVLRLREEKLLPALLSLASAIGATAGKLPLRSLAREIGRRLEELSHQWSDGRSNEKMRDAAGEALDRLEARRTELSRQAERWRADFAAAAANVGLLDGATVAMASAALDVWRTLPDTLFERENRARRVRGMERDIESFEDEVGKLCRVVAVDLVSVPASIACGELNDRVTMVRSALDRRSALATGLVRAEQRHDGLVRTAGILAADRADLAATAGLPAEDLASLLGSLHERLRVATREQEARQRFEQQAGGADEAHVREALMGLDRIAGAIEIERLDAEDARLVGRLADLRAAETDNERRRQDLEKGIGAERAVFQKRAAEEEARELARRWVVLKLAGTLLGHSMEAYREQQADPVMQRASDVFSELTSGRFKRLVQIYDESDELHLAVERTGGGQLPLSGLSEGTGDQLYLALRLAFLEDYCLRNEPAPLILDDIFQTFDDERTAAGLRTLGGASEKFQTILFTHQLSLVEAAQRELGDSVDLIRLERV